MLGSGSYDDYDGLSVLFDPDAVARRYGEQGQAFETSVYGDLPPLMAVGEVAPFGTRAGALHQVSFVLGRAPGEPLDGGLLRTSGQVALAGWHAFTRGCAHRGGNVDPDEQITVAVDPGWYRVWVDRRPDPDDPEVFLEFVIGLEPAPAPGERPLPREIPGADGFF
jgi:hypothetical protein